MKESWEHISGRSRRLPSDFDRICTKGLFLSNQVIRVCAISGLANLPSAGISSAFLTAADHLSRQPAIVLPPSVSKCRKYQ